MLKKNKVYCENCIYYDYIIQTPFFGYSYNKCLRRPKVIEVIKIPGNAISPEKIEYIYEERLIKCQIENEYNDCKYFEEES